MEYLPAVLVATIVLVVFIAFARRANKSNADSATPPINLGGRKPADTGDAQQP